MINAHAALRRTVDGQIFFMSLLLFKKLSGRA